jgi:hypothetical protein
LYDPANPSNTWKFTKGIDYTFPPGVSIPAGAHILVVRTDPDIFRYVHNIPLTREVYGPYSDALDNDGDTLELSAPTTPEPGSVPYIVMEKIQFSDGSHPIGTDPWPAGADGTGLSLHRKDAAAYANDVDNWQAGPPAPMTPDSIFLEMQPTGTGMTLRWNGPGVLQSATKIQGPWTNLTEAASPFDIFADGQPEQYFRVYESTSP